MLVFGGVIVDHGQYQPFLKWKIFGKSHHFPVVGLEPKIHAKLGGPFLKKDVLKIAQNGPLFWEVQQRCHQKIEKESMEVEHPSFFIVLWLVVSTPLKNISQIGSSPQVGAKIKDIWNHHPSFSLSLNLVLFLKPTPSKAPSQKKRQISSEKDERWGAFSKLFLHFVAPTFFRSPTADASQKSCTSVFGWYFYLTFCMARNTRCPTKRLFFSRQTTCQKWWMLERIFGHIRLGYEKKKPLPPPIRLVNRDPILMHLL